MDENNAHILVAHPTLYPIGSLLRADPFMQVGCRRIPDSPLRSPLPAESRHGRLMRQSCHRIGMAIFTALSPQVASARPLARLDGLAPFRCSSRERDMSMANITRRKKGFPAGEKGGSTFPLSPADTAPRREGGKNASEWPPRSVPKLAAVHVTREQVASMDGKSGISPAGVDLCVVVNLSGGRSPNL